jgi:hypothetical protein
LGAAPIGEAASLLRDRNFLKGSGHCAHVISILVWAFDSCAHLQVVWQSETLRLRGPASKEIICEIQFQDSIYFFHPFLVFVEPSRKPSGLIRKTH